MHNSFLITNDLVNPMTNKHDMRHMYGVTNQDVFRWPAIKDGLARQLLGHFITTIHMPGIPLVLWGEEQAFYVLDSTASNYLYGRQPMSSATQWQRHGCYALGSTQYYQMPWTKAREGCRDDSVALDHRDPSHPIYNTIRHMHQLRSAIPVLNDGMYLQQLSNQTEQIVYPGSSGVQTETGLWSVLRAQFPAIQNLTGPQVWLVYSNLNESKLYEFDCSDADSTLSTKALVAPFSPNTTVRNLFYPYDEYTLIDGAISNTQSCLPSMNMSAYGWKAFISVDDWVEPEPMITSFVPGHDARIEATDETLNVELQFSTSLNCSEITDSIFFNGTTATGVSPIIDNSTVVCRNITSEPEDAYVGHIASRFSWSATLLNVEEGVHRMSVRNGSSTSHFLFRVGQPNNPIVFPKTANYSSTLLVVAEEGALFVNHTAPGADSWRYSTNFGSSFSDWMPYTNPVVEVTKQDWSGTSDQSWEGEHIQVEYYTKWAGSSDHVQSGDSKHIEPRRFPHMWFNGPYNSYGYDAGLNNELKLQSSVWSMHFMAEWSPAGTPGQLNVWGINPDGKPDQTMVLGDVDGDSVLDRLPPSSLSELSINITQGPPKPHLGWALRVHDGSMRFELVPAGNMWIQITIFALLWIVPILTGIFSVWLYVQSFYKVKFNKFGAVEPRAWLIKLLKKDEPGQFIQTTGTVISSAPRRRVLIATMEYNIDDWQTKVKIGGLGVMAELMGKNLAHQDLIWVVPCVGGVEYPIDTPAESFFVKIIDQTYEIKVQYHQLRNIKYVLLDAPVFRACTKANPYPARMDDLESGIYYSAWNQAIAEAIQRFEPDLYHINDYHGSVAPLYLLPSTIPVCLSLHNAEFQGLWPMRTTSEFIEVCSVFNLAPEIVKAYVQYGEVFNLLHAGASYLRIHQTGFGAVGVSKKYGKRSHARYPIFWGLNNIGALPNPDPSDTADWNRHDTLTNNAKVDQAFEESRKTLRLQAQQWAGLEENPQAELFVFVGRWSMQKGIDLIADVFPALLEKNSNIQLITVGPIIDLYGKFAALKLDKLMKKYPTRVFSKPEFTALPPYIFSGAEFALIPSRDEPFGLVAVEFGRKGALGVGARVGGLGNMPGWWYTVESPTVQHLTKQLQTAVEEALGSKSKTRALMRAQSALQRFPVKAWVEDLEILQSASIRIHNSEYLKGRSSMYYKSTAATLVGSGSNTPSGTITPRTSHRLSLQGLSERLKNLTRSRDAAAAPNPSSVDGPGHGSSSEEEYESLDVMTALPPIPAIGSLPREVSAALAPYDETGFAHHLQNADSDIEGTFRSFRSFHRPDLSLQRASFYSASSSDAPVSRNGPLSPTVDSLNWPLSSPSSPIMTPIGEDWPRSPPGESADWPLPAPERRMPRISTLSVDKVLGSKTDYNLQKVDAFFTDKTGEYYRQYEERLANLNGSNSVTDYAIEDFLIKSERHWFDKYRSAKLGMLESPSSTTLAKRRPISTAVSIRQVSDSANSSDSLPTTNNSTFNTEPSPDFIDEFLLGKDYIPIAGLKRYTMVKLGDWPVYAFVLALGQILSANSYQITLLTGEVGQAATKLYTIASIYAVTSVLWWLAFRRLRSVVCLSLPFLLYGLAFVLIGTAHFGAPDTREWMQNTGAGLYAAASSSGWLFFALNFGDEGGAQVRSWVFRACTIQGTQQLYVAVLWYWGSLISKRTAQGVTVATDVVSTTWRITAITCSVAVLLWGVGLVVMLGLPKYYRQQPGRMASFYVSMTRRKLVLWFFFTVAVQNFFLANPYGRNWTFLFASVHAKAWQVVLLVLLFFVGVWAAMLWVFGYLSKSHAWVIPLFAIGLGAPRWAQIWWGVSGLGLSLPWAGGYTASALLSRSIWLWLGVLDSIQGVGIGMLLLGTLTRVHVAFTLVAAQVIGSVATIVARAVGPNRLGPGPISPDVTGGIHTLWQPWFWVGLILNLSVCLGFFKFYRKEQLQKP